MDFDLLEKTWRQQIVTAGNEPTEAIVARLKDEVAVTRRRIRGGISLVALVLLTGWTVAIVGHITSIKRLTAVGLIAEAVYTILAVAFFVRAFHSARIVQEQNVMMGGTLRESATAALRTFELQIQNARIAGYSIPIIIAVCIWLFVSKHLAGDLRASAVMMASAFTVVFGATIGAIIWHRYRTHLLPRYNELAKTLHALDQGESD